MSPRPLVLTIVVLSVASCGTTSSGGDPQFEARQLAAVHQAAQDAAARPEVACALGGFTDGGVPGTDPSRLFVQLERGEPVSPEQERAVVQEVAEALWDSGVLVGQLDVTWTPGGPDLDEVLDSPRAFVDRDDLEAAFGPRPPLPTPRPAFTDPGNPEC